VIRGLVGALLVWALVGCSGGYGHGCTHDNNCSQGFCCPTQCGGGSCPSYEGVCCAAVCVPTDGGCPEGTTCDTSTHACI
jgi:hypothetical protein